MCEYSIGVLCRKNGVSVKGTRFYTDRGVLPPARVAQAILRTRRRLSGLGYPW
jgi:DNA-binding transcriptional MerR regulator